MKVGANLFHFRGDTRIGGKRRTCTGVKSPLNRKICAQRSVEFPVSLFSLRRKFSTKPYPPAGSLYVAPNITMSASPRAFECRSPVESSLFLQWSFVPLRDTDRVWQDIELDCHQCWCQDRFGFYRPLADTAWLVQQLRHTSLESSTQLNTSLIPRDVRHSPNLFWSLLSLHLFFNCVKARSNVSFPSWLMTLMLWPGNKPAY